jgi:deoxyribodipyrimidine photolyase
VLPNRTRLIAASSLTKTTLYLDRRLGDEVLSRLLVDADVANNCLHRQLGRRHGHRHVSGPRA